MKYSVYLFFLFTCNFCLAQKKGFESLAFAKSKLESILKEYSSTIDSNSETYKAYYFPLSKQYNSAKAEYDAYRGSMKDCILNNNNRKKIISCLQTKQLNVKSSLDSLDNILEMAYFQAYSKDSTSKIPITNSGHNTGLVTGDFIKTVLDSLVSGVINIWDQSKKYKKQFKDDYLSNIENKNYALSDFTELVKPPSKRS